MQVYVALKPPPGPYTFDMSEQEFVRLVELVSESPPGSLSIESKLEEFGWDSLGLLGLISALDRQGGHTVNPDLLADASTLRGLYLAAFGS